MSIKFYKTSKAFGEFSNFYKKRIVINSIKYRSTEHYYQSKKFEGTKWEEHIRTQTTPRKAADEGRRKDLPLRDDWEKVKNEIMFTALICKFEDPALRNLLLSTEEEELIEDAPFDYYWGCGEKGTGKNVLGKQLMALRTIIKKQKLYEKSMVRVITGIGKNNL